MEQLLAHGAFLGWGGPKGGLRLHIHVWGSAGIGYGGLAGAAFIADARNGLAPGGGALRSDPARGPGECPGSSLNPGHQSSGKRRSYQGLNSVPGAGPDGPAPRERAAIFGP